MKIILFTNARDEKHIKEWVAHHLNLGFDFIHIFDHKSIEPIADQFKINPKIRIQRINYTVKDLKHNLIDKARIHAKSYTWMLYLDADEFLILNEHSTVHQLLENYEQYNQVGINWLMFGSSNLSKEPDGMILENYLYCENCFNVHMKSFVRPNSVTGIITPHIYNTNNMNISINAVTKKPIKQQTENGKYKLDKNLSYNDIPVYIAHYLYQSYDVYISRKVNLPRDDENDKYRSIMSETVIHERYNDIINTSIRDKYCHQSAELMKTL